jgi:hypothetical protein
MTRSNVPAADERLYRALRATATVVELEAAVRKRIRELRAATVPPDVIERRIHALVFQAAVGDIPQYDRRRTARILDEISRWCGDEFARAET